MLNLRVSAFGFLDKTADRGLVEDLADRHRLHLGDDLEKAVSALLDLGFGGAVPFYQAWVINLGGAHRLPSSNLSTAARAGCRKRSRSALPTISTTGVKSARLALRPWFKPPPASRIDAGAGLPAMPQSRLRTSRWSYAQARRELGIAHRGCLATAARGLCQSAV